MKKVLITGVAGQSGSYLAELLLSKDYQVHGMVRRSSYPNIGRIAHLLLNPNFNLVQGDVTDSSCISRLVNKIQPDELYNLAAQSHVHVSFDQPQYTTDSVYLGALNCLEAIREFSPNTKLYNAASSEMFGKTLPPQSETSIMLPCSPYGVAKLAAYHLTKVYRESYGLFCSSGILFNHESPRRASGFVTKKITEYVASLYWAKCKNQTYPKHLKLGNTTAMRDFGFAGDYVVAMWLMLQQNKPGDFVVSTDEAHSVDEFAKEAFAVIGEESSEYIVKDPTLYRPNEVPFLLGNSNKSRDILKWSPKVNFKQLVQMMVAYDIAELKDKYVNQ